MIRKKSDKQEEVKLMKTEEIVKNMDILYHIKRKNENDTKDAIRLMNKLIELLKDEDLNEVYLSPTELIISANIIYGNKNEKKYSEVDEKICKLLSELGYMKV